MPFGPGNRVGPPYLATTRAHMGLNTGIETIYAKAAGRPLIPLTYVIKSDEWNKSH